MTSELINLQATRAMREADHELAIKIAQRTPGGLERDADWIETCRQAAADAHDAISRYLGVQV